MEDRDVIKAVEDYTISNLFPLLGDALSAKDSIRKEEANRFTREVLIDVNTRLWRLQDKVDTEYMKTEDFVNFLHKTLIKVALDVRKEKKRLFANLIVNSTLIGLADKNDGKKYLFDETIDKIDERLFDFILRMKSRCLTTDDDNTEGWKGTDEELAMLGVDDQTFRFNADYLLSVGVVVRLPRFNMNDEDGTLYYTNEYYVTQYGLDFVEYVREQDYVEEAKAEEIG